MDLGRGITKRKAQRCWNSHVIVKLINGLIVSSCYAEIANLYIEILVILPRCPISPFHHCSCPTVCKRGTSMTEVSTVRASINKARYTATPVACGWAEAIIRVNPSFGQEQ